MYGGGCLEQDQLLVFSAVSFLVLFQVHGDIFNKECIITDDKVKWLDNILDRVLSWIENLLAHSN